MTHMWENVPDLLWTITNDLYDVSFVPMFECKSKLARRLAAENPGQIWAMHYFRWPKIVAPKSEWNWAANWIDQSHKWTWRWRVRLCWWCQNELRANILRWTQCRPQHFPIQMDCTLCNVPHAQPINNKLTFSKIFSTWYSMQDTALVARYS